MKTVRQTVVFLLLLLIPQADGHAAQLRMQDGRIWLKADHEPLASVLNAFSHAGVRVLADPSIERTVTCDLEGREAEEAVGEILESLDYVLYWKMVNGPQGALPRLSEMQVYLPGRKERAEPLPGNSGNFVVARNVDQTVEYVQGEILIGLAKGLSKRDFELLLARIGGTVVEFIQPPGIYRIRVQPDTDIESLVRQLGTDFAVAVSEPNYVYKNPTPVPLEQGADELGSDTAVREPKIAEGAVPVAVLDTGIRPLSQLDDAVIGAMDANNPEGAVGDVEGHGTQMALIASGAVQPGGVTADEGATGAPVVAVRAFDDNGYASNVSLMKAILFAKEKGARVVNMSWGTEVKSRFLEDVVNYADEQGLALVASAGNEPTGRPVYPAAFKQVVGVAALTEDGSPWEQSNFGSFVSLSAPGKAAFPVGYQGPPGPYAGTSIASAYVANALSRYLTANPNATTAQAVKALKASLTATKSKSRYGSGALDSAAMNRLLRK